MFRQIAQRIIEKKISLSKEDCALLTKVPREEGFELFDAANRIRRHFRGNRADLCAITNAKSGACSEDCAYCAQSSRSSSRVKTSPLAGGEEILLRAREALDMGARRFCIVTSGRKITKKELRNIARAVTEIRKSGLLPCATLGLLSRDELVALKEAGLERYHHNLETSEGFFPEICSTHTYIEKLRTIEGVHAAGLSLCCGGLFGLGESWEDRTELAFAIREIGPDSVPLNFLIPIPGTRLGTRQLLDPIEALKIVSLFRFVLPEKEIRVCGGRMQTLGEFNSLVFFAGADGLLVGNYLTTPGRKIEDDLFLAEQCGLEYR